VVRAVETGGAWRSRKKSSNFYNRKNRSSIENPVVISKTWIVLDKKVSDQ
jgi:hypothetical protein